MIDLFPNNADLFAPPVVLEPVALPWEPRPLANGEWPPDYRGVFVWRQRQLDRLRSEPDFLRSARAYYSTRPMEFICHWFDTYNPRVATLKWRPFILFEKQRQFIQFMEELRRDEQNGLVEKCRDIGATWLVCAYSVWCFLFIDDFAFGWGSRKQELVDKIGDPDSIFEKMRLLIKRLPDVWLPDGWKAARDATFMKLINPANGSTITGESGDNIGRGGRKAMYGKDESAHYERPEKIEAALGDNTNVQVDISSVNGLGNVFHRRADGAVLWLPNSPPIPPGETRKFIFDWRDHPEKTQEWYDQRKAKAEREGMQHVFAQEVDRNYSAAVQNTIISYEWLQACIDAHVKVPYLRTASVPNVWMAGLDVADEGMDRNALALRQWIILRKVEEWGERDPGVTTRRMLASLRGHKRIKIQYDSIGVGSGVKTEYNSLVDRRIITPGDYRLVPWNAGAKVVRPFERVIPDDDQSELNKDFFGNMKAQAWWSLRTRCYKTWRAVTMGEIYSADELISFDSTMPLLMALLKELAQPTQGTGVGLRMIVDKKPNGTRSPNLADSVIQCFFPAPDEGGTPLVGSYSG